MNLNEAINTIKSVCEANNTCPQCPMNHNCNNQPEKWTEVTKEDSPADYEANCENCIHHIDDVCEHDYESNVNYCTGYRCYRGNQDDV